MSNTRSSAYTRATARVSRSRTYHCPLDITMDLIGGKWKAVVLWYMRHGPRRFGELSAAIPEVTEKMLSLQLKRLVEDGLVVRTAYAEVPPRVEYALTDAGQALVPALTHLARWGKEHSGYTCFEQPTHMGPPKRAARAGKKHTR